MNPTSSPSRVAPLWIIAIILVVAVLHWMQVLILPIAFSLFLMALVWPVHVAIEGRRSRWLALATSVFLVVLVAAAFLLLIWYGIRTAAGGLASYGTQIQETYRSLETRLEEIGVLLWPGLAEQLSPGALFHIGHEAAVRINAAVGFLALTLVFLVLGLLEARELRHRLPHALGSEAAGRLMSAFGEIGWKLRRYMLVRTAVSLLTGLLTWLFALIAGLEFAALWGVLAFALNYIPFIGSVVAVVPPVLFALVQFSGWQQPVFVLAGMAAIQFSIGNFLDPRLEGRALAISPFVVLVSIFFWGLIWGIPGAFIGVPLTIAIITVCNSFHASCWIARLVAPRMPADDDADTDSE
jgi:AI-2 transport protein TqsA